jgi:hypothetical protein
MEKATMHEHMGHRLPPVEKRRGRIEKSELLYHEFLIEGDHYHHQHIDDDYVLYRCGDVAHEASPVASI